MGMTTRGAPAATTALLLLITLLGAGFTLPASAAQAATGEDMVSFGDSVPSGARCECTAYPLLYARAVAGHTGHPVRMVNRAFGGATSATVLRQVRTTDEESVVHTSAVAVVMVGANDFVTPFRRVLHHRQRAVPAYRPVAARVQANVTAIIRRLRALRPGIRVLVLDYWNVVKDGRVGRRAYGPWGMRKAVQATAFANTALRRAASATGSTYVSTLREFKGIHGRSDPTWLLAPDGDHPNARGHRVIAGGIYRAAPTG